MNKTVVKNALILTAFTLVCGLLLGLVYNITKDRIASADLKAMQQAYREVFSDADDFSPLKDFDAQEADALVSDAGYNDTIDDVQTALIDGQAAGYVFVVTAKDGSQGSITFCVGIRSDGTIGGISITDTSETPGLGLKASDESFSGQFVGKAAQILSVTTSSAVSDSEIEAITGSTITSKAVTNGCNAAILYFETLTGGNGDE